MNWERLEKKHYRKEPVEHIYTSSIFDMKEYDRLYENQNNLSHQVWQEFNKKYHVDITFLEDIRDIQLNKDVICLWFFKDRNDKSVGKNIKLADTTIRYYPNTFLVTESKDMIILEKDNQYIRRPVLQIDLNKQKFNEIITRFK
jgi:hypothetical protein